ncbi:PAS domain S-box protein [Halobacillus litoralis]|uniref:PAS domain-containing sensor histidine kinase n=1 Tax=Halobacillus litoralis TaxID=45668 RepID=UPI001CD1A093|nr:PAS domain-containing sensor histidine kinase [Halobacillus litoralis]MCA0971907.1 PAS domain S-box protein [Halobacillus litoralis]
MNATPACLLDLRNQTVSINQEMQGFLRIDQTELPLSKWMLLLPQSAQQRLQQLMHRLMTEGLKEKAVHISEWNMQCQLIHLTNGQIALTVKNVIGEEPVQRQQTETESGQPLKESPFKQSSMSYLKEKSFSERVDVQNLLNRFPVGVAIISHEWDIMYANEKMEELTGLTFKESHRSKLWDLYSIEEYYDFFQHYLRAMEKQESVEFEGFLSDRQITVEVTVHPSESGLLIFLQDVSSHKQQLQALKESEERFAILANNMKDVFWISDENFSQIHYLSPAFQSLFGMSRREALSDPESVLKVVHPEDVKRVKAGLALMRSKKHQVEYRLKPPNGDEKCMLTKGFPVQNHGTTYVIGIHEDVTEKNEMARLKEKSQQLSTITQMSAGIAHEIKNPLTAIKGFLQIGAANPELRDHYQNIILDEVNRIEAIVQDFMMLSKPKASLQKEEVEPGSVVNYVTRLLQPEADEKNVQLIYNPKSLNDTINTEPKRLNQILINLVKNGIDAVEHGGIVSIVAELSSQELTLSVSDNGPGLSAQELSKIGEPFFTTKEKGTGLGVMVTKKIVGDLSGTISYKSKKGEGTKVTVRLPR